jgi:Peptidase S24-like
MEIKLEHVYNKLFYLRLVRSKSDFAQQMGYGRSYITDVMGDDKPIPYRLRESVRKTFNLSESWFDELQRELDGSETQASIGAPKEIHLIGKHVAHKATTTFGNWPGLPMYNVPITASFIETYRDETYFTPAYRLLDPRFRDCNFGTIVTGDSMHSEIRHGDHVICQEITDKSFIVYGDIYYVVADNGLETCKYINADPRSEDNVLLVARNENISPSPIRRTAIKRLFKVRGVLRAY